MPPIKYSPERDPSQEDYTNPKKKNKIKEPVKGRFRLTHTHFPSLLNFLLTWKWGAEAENGEMKKNLSARAAQKSTKTQQKTISPQPPLFGLGRKKKLFKILLYSKPKHLFVLITWPKRWNLFCNFSLPQAAPLPLTLKVAVSFSRKIHQGWRKYFFFFIKCKWAINYLIVSPLSKSWSNLHTSSNFIKLDWLDFTKFNCLPV